VTQTIAYEGAGRWKEYAGGYTDWQRARSAGAKPPAGADGDAGVQASSSSPKSDSRGQRKRAKLGFNEARELDRARRNRAARAGGSGLGSSRQGGGLAGLQREEITRRRRPDLWARRQAVKANEVK